MMTKKKTILLIALLVFAGLCFGAAVTSDPWTGAGWNTSAPNDEALVGNTYKELQDLRKGVELRMNREHQDMASSSVGGWHTWGSAVCYWDTSDPCNRPDNSTSLDSTVIEGFAIDWGRLWIDDNYDPPVLRRWNGTNFTEMVAAHLQHATALEFLLESTENANSDGSMDSKIRAVGYKDAAGDCDLAHIVFSHDGTSDDQKGKVEIKVNDGDDDNAPSKTVVAIGSDELVELSGGLTIVGAFTGGASSDIAINTNKFTVAASTGNTLVAGTLTVTGESTFNNHINLGAGDDLIGSATSDIAINTDKFTVAGATGNTVIAGTLSVTGASTFSGGIFGASTNEDDEPTAMLKSHAYLANQDGFITAVCVMTTSGHRITGYVDTDNNPASGGIKMGENTTYSGGNKTASICFPVASGKYFEIVVDSGTPSIYWQPIGTLVKPTDQD